jgi:hypothetical protein
MVFLLSSVAAVLLLLMLSSSNITAEETTVLAAGRPMSLSRRAVRRDRVVKVATVEPAWETLLSDTFENDGGNSYDPARWSTGRTKMAHRSRGTYSVRFVKNNNKIELLQNVAKVPDSARAGSYKYDLIKIQFFFKAWGMKTTANHRMGLDISRDGGVTWTRKVKEWVYPQDFQVRTWYDTTVIVDPTLLNVFDNDAAAIAALQAASASSDDKAVLTDQFRFRLTMKGITAWTEVLHVDNVVVSGIVSEPDTLPDDEELPPHEVSYCPVGRKELSSSNEVTLMTNNISYMVQSRQTYKYGPSGDFHNVAWIGSNGSQDSISAIDLTTGELICTYELSFHADSAAAMGPAGNNDWESMSLGPCTTWANAPDLCLYLGNTGNDAAEYCLPNQACPGARSVVEIYKLVEPNINLACPSPSSSSPVGVATIQVDYTHEAMPLTFADSNALFVDFAGDDSRGGSSGDIYMVTKYKAQGDLLSRVVKIPVRTHANLSLTPNSITPHPLKAMPVAAPGGLLWTGADMSTDGRLITLRDMEYVYFYSRRLDQSVEAAILAGPCPFASRTASRGVDLFETVALVDNRDQMVEVSECFHGACDVVKVTNYALWASQNPNYVGAWKDILSVEDFDLEKRENESARIWSTPTVTASPIATGYEITPAKSVELSNTGTGTSTTTTMLSSFKNLDYDQVRVMFSFYMTGFIDSSISTSQQESSSSFYLEVSFNNGAYWIRVKTWTYHQGVVNDKPYVNEVVILDRADRNFFVDSYATKFRFRLDTSAEQEQASDNKAYLYIDNIAVQGRTLAFPI